MTYLFTFDRVDLGTSRRRHFDNIILVTSFAIPKQFVVDCITSTTLHRVFDRSGEDLVPENVKS